MTGEFHINFMRHGRTVANGTGLDFEQAVLGAIDDYVNKQQARAYA